MEWQDEGVILGVRRHGETSAIVEVMTPARGRHLGLVRGARSSRMAPVLQPGNSVQLVWRARLEDHLGNFTLEADIQRAARLMETSLGLYGVQTIASHLRLLPERDPHARLYQAALVVLENLDEAEIAARLMIRFELALLDELGRELRLRNALATVEDQYDFILIDCPPSLNMLTVNALVAAEAVIIPTQCEYFALEGLSALLETVEKIKKYLNPELKVEGFLRTMYDPRNNLATQVSQQLIQHFGEKVYRTVIPRNVRLAEAPSHGLPALLYDKASSGALAYLALAGEMLRRAEASAA